MAHKMLIISLFVAFVGADSSIKLVGSSPVLPGAQLARRQESCGELGM